MAKKRQASRFREISATPRDLRSMLIRDDLDGRAFLVFADRDQQLLILGLLNGYAEVLRRESHDGARG